MTSCPQISILGFIQATKTTKKRKKKDKCVSLNTPSLVVCIYTWLYNVSTSSQQLNSPLDHRFSTYQVSIMQSCDLCGSYIWGMEKAYMCSGELNQLPENI